MNRLNSIQDLETLRQKAVARRQQLKKWIRVCAGTACHSQGGEELVRTFQQYLEGRNLTVGLYGQTHRLQRLLCPGTDRGD